MLNKQASTCYINNYCFAEGDMNGKNLICQSATNNIAWTPLLSKSTRLHFSVYLIFFNVFFLILL